MKGLSVLSECEGLLVRGLGVYKIGLPVCVYAERVDTGADLGFRKGGF